jgi:ubiquitin carboxyl-terminal hydrolase 25/28
LGIDPVASDANVIFAFKKQVETDPNRVTWYLSYLQQIANVRQSEELQFEVVLQQSQGHFTIEQVEGAYNYFFTTADAADDHIIGTYKSRLSDAPRQDNDMREQLRILGEHRNSRKIKDVAKGSKYWSDSEA